MTARRAWKPLAIAAMIAAATAALGGLMTDIGPWYIGLKKPAFQPPDWLFGPAWTLIFALIALSAASAWQSAPHAGVRRWIIVLFGFNLALNVFWSALFFGLHRPDWALYEVVFLWGSVAALIWSLWSYSRLASWLLVPYLAWVTFASLLNMEIVRLNYPFVGS